MMRVVGAEKKFEVYIGREEREKWFTSRQAEIIGLREGSRDGRTSVIL